MSANGHGAVLPVGMILCAACPRPFMRRFPGERYCSNACAATGTVSLPAAKPVEKPKLRRQPAPAEPPKAKPIYGTPRAVLRSRRWMDEHAGRVFP